MGGYAKEYRFASKVINLVGEDNLISLQQKNDFEGLCKEYSGGTFDLENMSKKLDKIHLHGAYFHPIKNLSFKLEQYKIFKKAFKEKEKIKQNKILESKTKSRNELDDCKDLTFNEKEIIDNELLKNGSVKTVEKSKDVKQYSGI